MWKTAHADDFADLIYTPMSSHYNLQRLKVLRSGSSRSRITENENGHYAASIQLKVIFQVITPGGHKI